MKGKEKRKKVKDMYPNYYQQPQLGLKGRPVSSVEEVKASPVDFDGTIFFFPDLPNRRIYTKQINMDGTATIQVYELSNVNLNPMPNPNPNNYITKEELYQILGKLKGKSDEDGIEFNF